MLYHKLLKLPGIYADYLAHVWSLLSYSLIRISSSVAFSNLSSSYLRYHIDYKEIYDYIVLIRTRRGCVDLFCLENDLIMVLEDMSDHRQIYDLTNTEN